MPPSTGPGGTSVSILHLNVVNLDRSIALFRDALGFEATTLPAAPRSGAALVGAPGAMLRTAILKAPGRSFSLELVEWLGTGLRPQKARIQDPGAVMLAMTVDDINVRLDALRRQPGTLVLTGGGRPYVSARPGGENHAVMVEDENGFVIELVQNLPTTAPGRVSIYLTVADLAQTVNFYNKVIGFTMMAPAAPSSGQRAGVEAFRQSVSGDDAGGARNVSGPQPADLLPGVRRERPASAAASPRAGSRRADLHDDGERLPGGHGGGSRQRRPHW